jgi:hypothetical protein
MDGGYRDRPICAGTTDLRRWAALAVGCVLAITLYLAIAAFGPRFGFKL